MGSIFAWLKAETADPVELEEAEAETEPEPEPEPEKTYANGEYWTVRAKMKRGNDWTWKFGFEQSYEDMEKKAIELADELLHPWYSDGVWLSSDRKVRIRREQIDSVEIKKLSRRP